MVDVSAPPPPRPSRKPAAERMLELWLFRSRWLMAPFYLGLVVALAALFVVFMNELWHELSKLPDMQPGEAILMALSLIDLSLAGNLLLIVILSGYENFVSKMDIPERLERPDWMGAVDFSGLKMKLIGSIVAISAIALLRTFAKMADGEPVDHTTLGWLIALHLTFVVSGALLAVMDLVASKVERH